MHKTNIYTKEAYMILETQAKKNIKKNDGNWLVSKSNSKVRGRWTFFFLRDSTHLYLVDQGQLHQEKHSESYVSIK